MRRNALAVLLQCLVRHDVVDFCEGGNSYQELEQSNNRKSLPPRIFWNAVSTLEASNAEVSMKDRLFSSVDAATTKDKTVPKVESQVQSLTCEMFCLFRRHCAQMSQIALVSDQHDDNIGVRVVAQLLEPSRHVGERLLLGDIVHEKCSHRASVVADERWDMSDNGKCRVTDYSRGCNRSIPFLSRWMTRDNEFQRLLD